MPPDPPRDWRHRRASGLPPRTQISSYGHEHKHKPCVNRDDSSTSTSARSFFLRLCLRRPGSYVADTYACAYACVVRVNQLLAKDLGNTSHPTLSDIHAECWWTSRKCAFLPCDHRDFESPVSLHKNVEFKGSFHSSSWRSLHVKKLNT